MGREVVVGEPALVTSRTRRCRPSGDPFESLLVIVATTAAAVGIYTPAFSDLDWIPVPRVIVVAVVVLEEIPVDVSQIDELNVGW